MNHATKFQLVAFEARMKELFEAGELPFLLHFCGGNEDQLIEIFREIKPGDWIFSSHRSHYHYLLAGGSPERLEQMIRDGDSMFIFDKELNFLTSSVLAGTACIAAGVAWKLKEERQPWPGTLEDWPGPHVWNFLGDGAEDEGHFYEAVAMVHGHDLPCTFIVENNDRSVDTNIEQRRGNGMHQGLLHVNCVRRYHYTPTYPHGGSGTSKRIQFNPAIRPRPVAMD
jgi:TPP-dependent pyruvate/acetoin dehydrogenase alpha subunit